MPFAQTFGRDQVQVAAERFSLGVAEHPLGTRVPQRDGAAVIGGDHGVADGGHELVAVDGCLHGIGHSFEK